MGAYVDPPEETKESFLNREGKLIRDFNFKYSDCPKDSIPIILIDNGLFTAAGIAYCEDEYNRFTDPEDVIPKRIYLVEREKLKQIGCVIPEDDLS